MPTSALVQAVADARFTITSPVVPVIFADGVTAGAGAGGGVGAGAEGVGVDEAGGADGVSAGAAGGWQPRPAAINIKATQNSDVYLMILL